MPREDAAGGSAALSAAAASSFSSSSSSPSSTTAISAKHSSLELPLTHLAKWVTGEVGWPRAAADGSAAMPLLNTEFSGELLQRRIDLRTRQFLTLDAKNRAFHFQSMGYRLRELLDASDWEDPRSLAEARSLALILTRIESADDADRQTQESARALLVIAKDVVHRATRAKAAASDDSSEPRPPPSPAGKAGDRRRAAAFGTGRGAKKTSGRKKWYSCRECSCAFPKWSLCLAHLQHTSHMAKYVGEVDVVVGGGGGAGTPAQSAAQTAAASRPAPFSSLTRMQTRVLQNLCAETGAIAATEPSRIDIRSSASTAVENGGNVAALVEGDRDAATRSSPRTSSSSSSSSSSPSSPSSSPSLVLASVKPAYAGSAAASVLQCAISGKPPNLASIVKQVPSSTASAAAMARASLSPPAISAAKMDEAPPHAAAAAAAAAAAVRVQRRKENIGDDQHAVHSGSQSTSDTKSKRLQSSTTEARPSQQQKSLQRRRQKRPSSQPASSASKASSNAEHTAHRSHQHQSHHMHHSSNKVSQKVSKRRQKRSSSRQMHNAGTSAAGADAAPAPAHAKNQGGRQQRRKSNDPRRKQSNKQARQRNRNGGHSANTKSGAQRIALADEAEFPCLGAAGQGAAVKSVKHTVDSAAKHGQLHSQGQAESLCSGDIATADDTAGPCSGRLCQAPGLPGAPQPPTPTANMKKICLQGFWPLQVPLQNCERVLEDIKQWKNCHLRALDVNCDEVPASFQTLVMSHRCALLFSVVEDMYLRLRQQVSFFNHCKLKGKKRAEWKHKVVEGQVSIREAATRCGVRSCDGINILVGKKSQRAALRRNLAARLRDLEHQRSVALQTAAARGQQRGSWQAYQAEEKASKLRCIMEDNERTFREVDELNSQTIHAGESGEDAILEQLLVHCGVSRDDFWTEDELKRQNALAKQKGEDPPYHKTPDFLFKQTVAINGRCVRWIDSKNNLIVPGLTIPPQISKYRRQINAYVESFGPGLVIWHTCFFQLTATLYSRPELVFELSVPSAKSVAIAAGQAMHEAGVEVACPKARAILAAATLKAAVADAERLKKSCDGGAGAGAGAGAGSGGGGALLDKKTTRDTCDDQK